MYRRYSSDMLEYNRNLWKKNLTKDLVSLLTQLQALMNPCDMDYYW